MTEPTVSYLNTGAGRPPIKIVDTGETVAADPSTPVEATTGDTWGIPYDPSSDAADVRLNLDADGLTAMLNRESDRLYRVTATLERLQDEIAHRFGNLDHAETYEKLKNGAPLLFEQLVEAENRARSIANLVRSNATAVARETNVRPLTLDRDEQERAATLTPLVERQVERGRLSDIRDAFRVALVNDDRPTLYLYVTMLPDRLAAKPTDNGDGMRREDADKALKSELATMVSAAKTRLRDESLKALNTRANALDIAVSKLERRVRTRKRADDLTRSGLVRRAGY